VYKLLYVATASLSVPRPILDSSELSEVFDSVNLHFFQSRAFEEYEESILNAFQISKFNCQQQLMYSSYLWLHSPELLKIYFLMFLKFLYVFNKRKVNCTTAHN